MEVDKIQTLVIFTDEENEKVIDNIETFEKFTTYKSQALQDTSLR